MNPLQARLAALRRRLRVVVTFRGVCWLLSLVLATAALTGLLDWRVHHAVADGLPSLLRALILTGALATAGYLTFRLLIRPLWSRTDDLSLALRVEALYPSLNDSLASTVEFLQQPEDSDQSGSPGLRHATVKKALRKARDCDFNRAVPLRGVPTAGLSLAFAAALALFLLLGYPSVAWTALARLADPFGRHDWPRQTQLAVTGYRARVARGDAYEIRATLAGVVPEQGVVELRGMSPVQQSCPVSKGEMLARLDRVEHDFAFRVQANDAASDWYAVAVLPPPALVPLDGRPSPQVHLRYPAYTDLPEQDLPDGSGNIDAVVGTLASFRAGADRPLVRAWIEYRPEQALVRPAAFLGPLGAPHPAGYLALSVAGEEVWGPVPVRLESGGRVLAADFLPRVSGVYALHFEDESGLESTRLFDLRVQPDPAPVVNLERPSKSRDSLDVLPGAEVPVQVVAEDRQYAVRSVYLEYRCRREEPPRQVPLYEHQAAGEAIPSLLSALSGAGLPGWARLSALASTPPLRLRSQRVQAARPLSLARIRCPDGGELVEGDTVILQACADDFDDVTVNKQPGRSSEVELRVVSRAALEANLNQAQAKVQQELLKLRQLQQEALEHVIGPEQRWRDTGRLEARDLDQLRQAEQIQQQVHARVGATKDEGLRGEVAKVRETLRANRLPRSGANERMETVAGELERLARDELSQVEPRLTNARKENEVAAQHPKPAPGEKGLLGEARQHQEEVESTLNDLLKLLEPWGNVNEVKGEARSILQEQRKLREQTRQLDRPENRGQGREDLDPDRQANLDQAAELQRRLAEQARQLLEKMGRVGQEGEDAAPEKKAIREAAAEGRKEDVPGQMKAAAENLRRNRLGTAGEQQARGAAGLEKVVQTLEERREKELDLLKKKLKEAEGRVKDLEDRQDRLRKKIKDAASKTDPGEREQALKALAGEQEALTLEAQERVRELTRLRAEQAGQALGDAAGNMDQAGQQLSRGQTPDEAQEETLDRLREAQRQLQQAQSRAEDELKRERLAKVAEQLKLLKERQEGALAESDRLQQSALQHREWTRALLSSMGDLADVQKGLGEETRSLARDRLAGARVVQKVLERCADTMDQASDQVLKHRDRAVERPEETAEEGETRRLQQEAVRRLGQVLDAVRSEAEHGQRRDSAGGGGGGSGGAGGAPRGGEEAIPPLAQLKLLKAMQQEINDRTDALGKKHPEPGQMTDAEKRELKAIRSEQTEVGGLLEELLHPGEPDEGAGVKDKGQGAREDKGGLK